MHVAADLCTQAVDDLVQSLGAGSVHVDEELILVCVCARRTRLDVGEVDAFLLWSHRHKLFITAVNIYPLIHRLLQVRGLQDCVYFTTRGQCLTKVNANALPPRISRRLKDLRMLHLTEYTSE